MLSIKIPAQKVYDENTSTFYDLKDTVLHLEHSLIAISKWESKWQKPFLDQTTPKTVEEITDYIRCMCVDEEEVIDPYIWKALSRRDAKRIEEYISNKMTASTVNNRNKKPQKKAQVFTSELIYYYMSALGIPFECENWHFSRLMMLIQIAVVEQQGPQKMPRNEMISQRNALNKARQAKMRKP
jgi:hypothetical protein